MTPQERKAVYLEYMKMKIAEEDWHGVADCAMDLREIEVEIRMHKVVIEQALDQVRTSYTYNPSWDANSTEKEP